MTIYLSWKHHDPLLGMYDSVFQTCKKLKKIIADEHCLHISCLYFPPFCPQHVRSVPSSSSSSFNKYSSQSQSQSTRGIAFDDSDDDDDDVRK